MAIARDRVIANTARIMWCALVQSAWNRHQETTIRRPEKGKEAREEEIAVNKRAAEKNSRDRARQHVDTELNSQHLRELAEQKPRVIAMLIRQLMSKELKQ